MIQYFPPRRSHNDIFNIFIALENSTKDGKSQGVSSRDITFFLHLVSSTFSAKDSKPTHCWDAFVLTDWESISLNVIEILSPTFHPIPRALWWPDYIAQLAHACLRIPPGFISLTLKFKSTYLPSYRSRSSVREQPFSVHVSPSLSLSLSR